MPKIEAFEKHADRYEKWFDDHPNAFQSEVRAIQSLLPSPGLAVEVGVGTGRFASELGIGYGVEPSISMARYAKEKGIDVAIGVAEDLPLEGAGFDSVLLIATLCFVDDVVMAARETYRILKPEGSMVAGIIDSQSALGKAYEARKRESTFYAEAKFLSVQKLAWYLSEAGFEEFAFAKTIFGPPEQIDRLQPPREGYGLGSFVVVRAMK